jgi:hypothetical protein
VIFLTRCLETSGIRELDREMPGPGGGGITLESGEYIPRQFCHPTKLAAERYARLHLTRRIRTLRRQLKRARKLLAGLETSQIARDVAEVTKQDDDCADPPEPCANCIRVRDAIDKAYQAYDTDRNGSWEEYCYKALRRSKLVRCSRIRPAHDAQFDRFFAKPAETSSAKIAVHCTACGGLVRYYVQGAKWSGPS